MKRIGVYLGVTFATAWFMEYALIANGGLESRWAQVAMVVVLFMPALGNALARIITKEGFSDMYLRLERADSQSLRTLGAAWLLTVGAAVLGILLYFALHPSMLDLNMDYYTKIYREAYQTIGKEYSDGQIHQALITQLLLSLFFLPVLNLIPALASELGWRGYLFPKLMEKFKAPTAILLGGVAWTFWYGPLIEMGQYYGTDYPGYPFTGMGAMLILFLALGSFFSWLTYRTKSCLPSAIAFSLFNSFSTAGIYFCGSDAYSPFVGPAATGILGGMGFLILGVFSMVKLRKMTEETKEKKKKHD